MGQKYIYNYRIPKYKKVYEQSEVDLSISEDHYNIYHTTYFCATKKTIDINDKLVIIESKRLIERKTNKIPKNNGCSII
jgi:hypothetical protein